VLRIPSAEYCKESVPKRLVFGFLSATLLLGCSVGLLELFLSATLLLGCLLGFGDKAAATKHESVREPT
jgi:hypothetical protein